MSTAGNGASSFGNFVGKHIIEISRNPYHLSIRDGRLLLLDDHVVAASIPCDEICMVVVDSPQTTYTHCALSRLTDAGAVVVVCGANHLPNSVLLPIADHSEVVWRLRDQIECGVPRRKRLWQQIVKAKVRAQANNLPRDYAAHQKLMELSQLVLSGDRTNIEANAARIYWQNWLWQKDFQRDQDADGLNASLNYGYAILRAAVARALVGAGLAPMLGVHHRHRANSFCLADDLMEPLRPIVDARVREMYRLGCEQLDQRAKSELLGIIMEEVEVDGTVSPFMIGLNKYVSSLVNCFAKKQSHLSIPVSCT